MESLKFLLIWFFSVLFYISFYIMKGIFRIFSFLSLKIFFPNTELDMKEVLNRLDAMQSKFESEIRSLNDKIMTTRYIIGVGFGIIALLITVFKFLG